MVVHFVYSLHLAFLILIIASKLKKKKCGHFLDIMINKTCKNHKLLLVTKLIF